MKIIRALLVMNVFLILSGIGWIVFGTHFAMPLTAFNRPVAPNFLGSLIILFGIYQSIRLRKAYLKVKKSEAQMA